MNKKLAASLVLIIAHGVLRKSSQAFVLKAGEVAKTLKTVVVVAKKDNFFAGSLPGTNACGDYVCMNGILNCTNHPNDRFSRLWAEVMVTALGAARLFRWSITVVQLLAWSKK